MEASAAVESATHRGAMESAATCCESTESAAAGYESVMHGGSMRHCR